MFKSRSFLVGGAVIALAGCAGETSDTSPPTLAFFEGKFNSPFYASNGSGSNDPCPNGLADAYSSFRGGPELVQARSGGASVSLRVTFSDPAGIKRAYLQIPGGTLSSPNVTRTVPVPTATGDVSQAFEYNFTGDAASPTKQHTVNVELTHGDANRVFNAFAIDMNDNRSETATLLIGELTRICK
ncbi:hypothetical protein [Tropicimonas sp. S265A]|uniref:hypothetical protein n=1 Tax=Tropicimonas sp. S265A TaxID=3415134 RepID=UPI003C7A4218